MPNPDVITIPCSKARSLTGVIYQYRFDITEANTDFTLHTLTNASYRWSILAIKNVKGTGVNLTIKSGSSNIIDKLESGAESGLFGALNLDGWYFGEVGQNLVLQSTIVPTNGCIHVAEILEIA